MAVQRFEAYEDLFEDDIFGASVQTLVAKVFYEWVEKDQRAR